MRNQFREVNVEVANAATLAAEPLREPLAKARLAFVKAKDNVSRLEAQYIQAWNDAARAAEEAEQQQDDADELYHTW
jgi:hypothetical protein